MAMSDFLPANVSAICLYLICFADTVTKRGNGTIHPDSTVGNPLFHDPTAAEAMGGQDFLKFFGHDSQVGSKCGAG